MQALRTDAVIDGVNIGGLPVRAHHAADAIPDKNLDDLTRGIRTVFLFEPCREIGGTNLRWAIQNITIFAQNFVGRLWR
jgi:hypothetical protein